MRTRKFNKYLIYGWVLKSPARYKQIDRAMRIKFWGMPIKWTRKKEGLNDLR